jgi:hypothetical protein
MLQRGKAATDEPADEECEVLYIVPNDAKVTKGVREYCT